MSHSPLLGFITWMNRRRAWISGLAAVLLVGVGIYLVNVQMRPTMTTAAFETQMGLVMQDYQAGRYELALAKLNVMETKGGRKNPLANFLKGKVLYRQQAYAEAASFFELAARQSADNIPAYFNLGLSYFRSGDVVRSRQVFQQIVAKYSRSYPSMAAQAQQADQIVEDFTKLAVSKP